MSGTQLERDGGFFGWVLRLVQQRKLRAGEFRELVERVATHLQTMPSSERHRWRDLLSYIGAMVYHERSESEQARLHETVERSVQREELRQDVLEMGKTMADVLMEKGRTEGRTEAAIETPQQSLICQLRRRFGDLPANVASAVESTTDLDQLDGWLDRPVTASKLDELGISADT